MAKTIQEIVLTNFKKHRHLSKKIEGHSFMLIGRNGAGKSTVFQAIDHLCGGAPLADMPVSEGEEKGEIELTLQANNGDKYRVRRKFENGKLNRYELHRDAGNGRFDPITPAAERFQEIFGNLLDLTPIIDMTGKEQVEFIQEKIGKDADVKAVIQQVMAEDKRLRDERLLTGRSKKDQEAKLLDPDFRALVNYTDMEPIDIDGLKEKKVDISELSKEIADATVKNQGADGLIEQLRGIQNRLQDVGIKDALQNAIGLIAEKKVDVSDKQQQLQNASQINAAVDAEIEEARLTNAKIAKSVELVNCKNLIKQLTEEYESYNAQIRDNLNVIPKALKGLGLEEIYPGLTLEYELDDDGKVTKQGLYLRGLPFNRRQQSYGEMVRVIISLSKAFNPDGFGFLRILDWNLLDEDTQASILMVAETNEIQLGIEAVSNQKSLEIRLVNQN